MTRKQLLKQDEIAEVAFDFTQWIEENWVTALKWLGGALLVVVAVLVGIFAVGHRKTARENLLAEAQTRFQRAEAAGDASEAEFSAALTGFEDVIAKAGNSEPGIVAQYYKAATLRKLGRLDEAIAAAEQAAASTGSPATLLTSAELLLADLYTKAGRASDAIARLSATLESTSPVVPTDQALLELGRIHKSQGDLEAARKAWQRLVDEYPGSRAANDARQQLGPDA